MLEKNIEKKLRDGVKKLGGQALKFTSPSFAGVPDRIVLMPGGRIWFVELKAPGKMPTLLQVAVHRTLSKLGFDVRVIDTPELVNAFLIEIAK
jgi:hypothetical protein